MSLVEARRAAPGTFSWHIGSAAIVRGWQSGPNPRMIRTCFLSLTRRIGRLGLACAWSKWACDSIASSQLGLDFKKVSDVHGSSGLVTAIASAMPMALAMLIAIANGVIISDPNNLLLLDFCD